MATGLIGPMEVRLSCDQVTVHKIPPLNDLPGFLAWSLGCPAGTFGPQIGPAVPVDDIEAFSIRNTCEPTGDVLSDENWHLVLWSKDLAMVWLESFGPGEVFECSLPYVGLLS